MKVTRDISGRKRFEAELRKRAEFEQQLIGIVSHDLRTPLSAITLATTLMLRSDSLQDRHRATLMRVLSSAERAQRMIGSLLDFTQARVGGGFVLQYSHLDLQDFISLVMDEVRLVHPDNELQLKFSGAGQGKWDADRLAQLLTNLLNNAILHGLQDKPVQLHVSGGTDTVTLSVHNWGPPIPPEMMPHLFEPMRRGDNAPLPSRNKSVGLGLYIVQQVVLAHGGTIEVSSSEEQGTTFRVCLPRSPPSREARGDVPSAP